MNKSFSSGTFLAQFCLFFFLIFIFSSCHMKSLHALKKICIFTLTSDPQAFCTRAHVRVHVQFYRVCWNAMIRIHGKRVLTVLAFVMAICVSFQLGLIWSTRSSFFDIVREQLDVESHMQRLQLRELTMNHTTTSTSQVNYKSFLITRRSCMQHYDLLIIISSAPGNFERRNNIRKT